MAEDTYIQFDAKGDAVSFVGSDAVAVYRAGTLAMHLKLWAGTGIIPARGMTITKMLALASEITHKPYKRGDALVAAADLKTWALEGKNALPHVGPAGEAL